MMVLALDTETSGLVKNGSIDIDKQPEVLEFFGCLVDLKSGKLKRSYETLVKPAAYPMSDAVIAETKTRLTNEMLLEAPSFKDVASNIKSLIEKAPMVIAHNASFDQEMLDIEFKRLGQTIQWPRLVCTVEQSCHLKGYRLSLTNLHIELFGEPFPEAHRAKADVMALVRCAKEMFKRGLL